MVHVSEIVTQDIIYNLSGRAIVWKDFIVSCAKMPKKKMNGSVYLCVHICVC